MSAKKVVISLGFVVLLVISGFFAYELMEQKKAIHVRNVMINETLADLEGEIARANELNETVAKRDREIITLHGDVSVREERISQQQQIINEIKDTAEKQEQEIQHLREVQASLNEQGKIIVDQYGASLVLYDNVDIFEKQSPFMEVVKNDPINYGKLGIPFFYFRDETRTTEDGVILGSYSSLYNYIYIYHDNDEVRTLYHEIGHIIYQKLFVGNKNEQTWEDFYRQLKDRDLLSTTYAETNEIEGFAEEYSVYKTGIVDQPDEVENFFEQVDNILR